MNFYNSYTASKKKKILRRVAVLLVSALVITGCTVVFGNYLKKKAADSSGADYGVGLNDSPAETEEQVIIPPSKGGDGNSVTINGMYVPMGSAEDVASIVKADGDKTENSFEDRLEEAAKGNSGVLIPLVGDDGYLLYNSKRAGEASRLPENPTIPDMIALKAVVDASKAKGLRVCALIRSGVTLDSSESEFDIAVEADSRIAADAAEVGFDEVIIMSLVADADDIRGENSHFILKYLNQICAVAGDTDVGLSLPSDVYETSKLSPQIEMIASRSVFLAMELNEVQSSTDYMTYICENLAGTLSVYNMRMLISPKDTVVAGEIEDKLKRVEHENYLYTCIPEIVEEEPPEETEDIVTEKED